MEDIDFRDSVHWTVPQIHVYDGKQYYIGGDSLVWTHEYPDNYYLHGDSLAEIYFDTWSDKFEEYEDLMILREDELMELEDVLVDYEEIMDLKELKEWEPFEHDFNFDYQYNYHFPGDLMGRSRSILKQELREDGLILPGREYVLLINQKQMYLNGEKQSRSMFKKYRRLIDSLEGYSVSSKVDELKIHIGR